MNDSATAYSRLRKLMIFAFFFVSSYDAFIKSDDSLIQAIDYVLIVARDNNRRASQIDAIKELHDIPGSIRVEVSSRFVCKKNGGIIRKCPGDADSLLFATGKLLGIGVCTVQHPYEVQNLRDSPANFLSRGSSYVQCKGDILPGGLLRQKSIVLKNHPDLAPESGNSAASKPCYVLPIDKYLPTCGNLFSIDKLEKSRLAGTGRTDQKGELALVDIQAYVLQSLYFVRVNQRYISKFYHLQQPAQNTRGATGSISDATPHYKLESGGYGRRASQMLADYVGRGERLLAPRESSLLLCEQRN